MGKRLLVLWIVLLLFISSFQAEVYAVNKTAVEEQYETGMEYFDRGDYDRAFSYFQISGEVRGYAPSQNMLGVCYRDGLGVEKNADEAERYFKLAAEQGISEAVENSSSVHKTCPTITSLTLDKKTSLCWCGVKFQERNIIRCIVQKTVATITITFFLIQRDIAIKLLAIAWNLVHIIIKFWLYLAMEQKVASAIQRA